MSAHVPTKLMALAAARALAWRRRHGRGGTAIGVHRAVQLVARQNLSLDTVRRMYSYFRRHAVDRKAPGFFRGPKHPSAGRIAWDLWGGDPGLAWVKRVLRREGLLRSK